MKKVVDLLKECIVLLEEKIDSKSGICFIVGHTKESPGAYSDYFKLPEYLFWIQRLSRFEGACKSLGVEFNFFLRDQGLSVAYEKATDWLEQFEKKCVVELHFNAFNKTATGGEVLVVSNTDYERAIATSVSRAMSMATTLKERPLKELKPGDRGYSLVTQVIYPSILIEPFFGDNLSDCEAFEKSEDVFYSNMIHAIKNNL